MGRVRPWSVCMHIAPNMNSLSSWFKLEMRSARPNRLRYATPQSRAEAIREQPTEHQSRPWCAFTLGVAAGLWLGWALGELLALTGPEEERAGAALAAMAP